MENVQKIQLDTLLRGLEEWAPLSRQESYDNAGLVLGNRNMEVRGALICFDVTPSVVEEAVEKGADLIISHHPPIFRGIKKIDPSSHMGRMLQLSLQHGIAWYAMHTNLDNTPTGVNSYLAGKLQLQAARPLVPMDAEGKTGAGVIGTLPAPMNERELLDTLKALTGVYCIRHSGFAGREIKTLALCGGSGGGFFGAAQAQGADAYVTGDVKYHDFADAEERTWLVDIGHYESEQFVKQLVFNYITEKFPKFAAHISERSVNPVSCY
ncbi:MAG: Nif3-like dinuclear metal center hexameric protein [Bacteroides sp.]|nr:Nif3-like dinuclear metal center hexameric protein [Bacteroides sp.]